MPRDGAEALEERAKRMRELLDRDPDDEVTWFGLGQTLLALGRPGEAAEALREALRCAPTYTAAQRDLGRALLEAGRADEARGVLERGALLAEQTRDLQTGREIAVLLARAGGAPPDEGSTPPPAARAEAAAPGGSAAARGGLTAIQIAREALRQLANERFARAIELYERAIAADPTLALAWNGLSVAWRHAGDLDRAIEAGQRLVELEPDDPLGHANLSILYQSKGMIPEAEQEKAIAMRLQMRASR